MCCLCIILNVTYYRNGAQGGRIRGRVIRSGAAPSRPDTRQGARSLPVPCGPRTWTCSWDVGVSSDAAATPDFTYHPLQSILVVIYKFCLQWTGFRSGAGRKRFCFSGITPQSPYLKEPLGSGLGREDRLWKGQTWSLNHISLACEGNSMVAKRRLCFIPLGPKDQ